jgi:hypothetical protein
VQQEAFTEVLQLVSSSPIYQQQISLKQLLLLSPIPHKRSVIDAIDQASQQQQAQQAQAQQLQQAGAEAKIAETHAKAQSHVASGFAKVTDALTYAHQAHADHIAQGVEKGIDAGQQAQGMAQDQNQFQSQQDQQAQQAQQEQQAQQQSAAAGQGPQGS